MNTTNCIRQWSSFPRCENVRDWEYQLNVEEAKLERMARNSLKWFWNVLRMQVYRWLTPTDKRKRVRPRESWSGAVREAMELRNIESDETLNREAWRRMTGRLRQTVVVCGRQYKLAIVIIISWWIGEGDVCFSPNQIVKALAHRCRAVRVGPDIPVKFENVCIPWRKVVVCQYYLIA